MKTLSLIYNELVKQFKKPSVSIIFAIILLVAVFLPMGISKIPQDIYSDNALESNIFLLEQAEKNIDIFKNDKTQKGKMLYKYSIIEKEYIQLYVDYKIGFDDWRKDEAENFKSKAYELAALEFVLQGFDENVIMENMQGSDPNEMAEYYNMTLAKRKEIEADITAKKEKFKNIIFNNDYMAHTEEEIKRRQEQIDYYNKKIQEYEKLKAENPKDDEGKGKLVILEKEAIIANESIKNLNEDIKVIQFRLENKIDYSLNNWKNNSIKTIESEIEKLRIPLIAEKEYSSIANQQRYSMSYDEYVKDYNNKNIERVNKIKEIWYGLEKNIPSLTDIRDARSVLDETYEIYIMLAVIMVIIIGGGIVATEFSKGTVRLLLIRPVSRWKVLLSKLLAVLIIGFSVVILGIGILYISTGFVFGFETYKTPLLQTINGNIVHVEFIKFIIPKILISCSSLIFIASLVFSVSTLSKNTALAVAISMIIYFGVALVTNLLVAAKQIWVIDTIIPYINASYFRVIPMISEILSSSFGMQMQYTQGAIQLLIASVVLLVISFISFIKKDVKN